jgi:hypothetical protein
MTDYKAHAEKALADFIEQLKAAPEGAPIVEANQHLLSGEANGSWAGGGLLELGGFIWWAASCDVILTDLSSGVKAVAFEASGTGFMVGAVESEVVGAFVVDPKTIGGKCHFTIVVAAVEGGVVTLTLYSTSGQLYGTFAGPAEGLAAGGMSGTGDLHSS